MTINAVTWNVCGGPGCPSGAAPAKLTKQVVQRMRSTEVGGRKVRTNAVLLQEVCEGHVRTFKKTMDTWTWAFAASPTVALARRARAKLASRSAPTNRSSGPARRSSPPPPTARASHCAARCRPGRPGCASRSSARPRATSGGRRRPAPSRRSLGTGRVLVGGDLADSPDSPALDPLYTAYDECDQSGASRTGAKTRQNWQGTAVEKTDYLFITKSAAVSCSVPSARTKASDHRPMSAEIRFT